MTLTFSTRLLKPLDNSRGAAAVMVAITMTVLLAMAAAALDIGHALVARNELQNAADAGALAGARALGILYEGMTPAAMGTYQLSGSDAATITTAVQSTAVLNKAAGVNVTVNIATPDAASFRQSQSQVASVITRAVSRGQRNL